MREFCINVNDAGQRLDKFLQKALPSLPASLLYKSIRTKKIKVNRHRATPEQKLQVGDTLQLFLAEEFFSDVKGDTASALARIRPQISVLYEDSRFMLLNKPAGVVVHEDEHGGANTLLTHMQAYLYQKGEYDPGAEQSFAPALCNRIDRNTAGIVIAAKTAEALRVMNEKIREHLIEKYCLCVVHGIPSRSEATLTAYLRKDEKEKRVYVFDKQTSGAKKIVTRYRTIASKGDLSLLEVKLLTGRTHQIRAHMAHIGHPLLGDGKYGVNREDRRMGYDGQALVSYRLVFPSGDKGEGLYDLAGKTVSLPVSAVPFVGDLFPDLPSDALRD